MAMPMPTAAAAGAAGAESHFSLLLSRDRSNCKRLLRFAAAVPYFRVPKGILQKENERATITCEAILNG